MVKNIFIEALLFSSPFIVYYLYVFIHRRMTYRPFYKIPLEGLLSAGFVMAVSGIVWMAFSNPSGEELCSQPGKHVDGRYVAGGQVSCSELRRSDLREAKEAEKRKQRRQKQLAREDARRQADEARELRKQEAAQRKADDARAARKQADEMRMAREDARRQADEARAYREEAKDTKEARVFPAYKLMCKESGHYIDGEYIEGGERPCSAGENP